ncbi:MAG: N-acetyl-gamma-glutamyl-phosphate reductase [Thermoplasmatota archaeon]
MINASVVGARGYLGRELVRLLHDHPHVNNVTPIATSDHGTPYEDHVSGFENSGLTVAPPEKMAASDVLFLATPGGVARDIARKARDDQTIIDLSRDHRLEALNGDKWTYGLADWKPVSKGTKRIANPGCYPTAAALAIAPALQAGLVENQTIIVDGKSGVSGAGIKPQSHLHYPEMNENTTAYKVTGHDHTEEMAAFAGGFGRKQSIRFTPHLVPQTRGLLDTVYIPSSQLEDAKLVYETAYKHNQFVHVKAEASTGAVRGSNHAHIAVDADKKNNLLVVRAAIDNLQKGGSGTAVQNMNDALGWESGTGLGGNP